MTSDLVQHQQANLAGLPLALREKSLPDLKSVPPVLEPYDFGDLNLLDAQGLQRSLSTAISILNKAHIMIERAEQTIARQSTRIGELENLTTIDELTGLLNRRGFFQAFVREIGRVDRELDEGGLLILVDVDNFNTVNKLYGQEAGDTCLRLVRHALKCDVRPMDLVARLGADEFVLLLSSTDKEKAASRIQKLAMKLNNMSFIWRGAEICVSASIGMKSYGKGDLAENIFKAADRELSRSKEKKKNYAV